jgi:uncharacterized protein YjiS (DUF1127 family)
MRNLDLLPGGEVSAEPRRDPPSLSLAEDLTGFALWLASPPVTLFVTLVRAWRHDREIRHFLEGSDPALKDIGLTRGDLQGIMSEPWWGRSRRELMRAAAERRNSAIDRARCVTAKSEPLGTGTRSRPGAGPKRGWRHDPPGRRPRSRTE